jgi:hypothetical protein
LSEVLTSDIKS